MKEFSNIVTIGLVVILSVLCFIIAMEERMTKEEKAFIKEVVKVADMHDQTRQLQEECGELIVAISHLHRMRPDAIEQFIEELVDVEILVEQMKEYFSAHEGYRRRMKLKKLSRLRKRLSDVDVNILK